MMYFNLFVSNVTYFLMDHTPLKVD